MQHGLQPQVQARYPSLAPDARSFGSRLSQTIAVFSPRYMPIPSMRTAGRYFKKC